MNDNQAVAQQIRLLADEVRGLQKVAAMTLEAALKSSQLLQSVESARAVSRPVAEAKLSFPAIAKPSPGSQGPDGLTGRAI